MTYRSARAHARVIADQLAVLAEVLPDDADLISITAPSVREDHERRDVIDMHADTMADAFRILAAFRAVGVIFQHRLSPASATKYSVWHLWTAQYAGFPVHVGAGWTPDKGLGPIRSRA